MAPELTDRLAKLLRLACSTGPDGEKLAAVGRLSAVAAAKATPAELPRPSSACDPNAIGRRAAARPRSATTPYGCARSLKLPQHEHAGGLLTEWETDFQRRYARAF